MGNLFAEAKLKTTLANDTYTDKKEIVSKAGYLLGVDKSIFDSGELLPEIYEELEKNQDARMVRNLCFLFTCIEHCYKQLQMQMVNDLKNLHSMDMTKAATEALRKDGLDIVKSKLYAGRIPAPNRGGNRESYSGLQGYLPDVGAVGYIRQMFFVPDQDEGQGAGKSVAVLQREYYQIPVQCLHQLAVQG